MKFKLPMLALIAVLAAGCAENDEKTHETAAETEIYTSNVSNTVVETEPPVPFSDYTFELKGTKENYMIIIRKGSHADEISVTVENNRYESSEFVISAPDGYVPCFPHDQKYAESMVNVISNDFDDTYIPDIMQLTFEPSESKLSRDAAENSAAVSTVSRMYTVDNRGELREINIISEVDTDGDGEYEEVILDYLDRTQLYHSEPDKFIYEISVDDSNVYDDEGNIRPINERVKIKTLEFDYSVPCFRQGQEQISEENPLYFGYAHWAAANSIAQYFTMTSFNVSDWDNYVEQPNRLDAAYTDYYFKIDDSRFDCVADLKEYMCSVFMPNMADWIFDNSPQNYCDINGELYGIAGDGEYDYSLGTLTFSGMEISEDRMLFRSRQEKFDEIGNYLGYTDGGNFVIVKDEDVWKVSQYRYPYSYN